MCAVPASAQRHGGGGHGGGFGGGGFRAKCALTLVVFSLLFSRSVEATTYYVAPDGSDENPGTMARPWVSPGHASRRLQAGDTLIVQAGRYILKQYDTDIITPGSGRVDAWITIKGEAGSRPVLAGRDNLLTAINLQGRNYVSISNLEITHDESAARPHFRAGVRITDQPAAHIILDNLYVHHIDAMGLDIQDIDDLKVLNSRFKYCGVGAIGGPAGTAGGVRNLVVRNSQLSWSGHYYQGGDGSNRPYPRPDGFGIEKSNGPILIEDSTSEHNYGDGLDSKAANTTIQRCVVANNSCDGVKLWADNSYVKNSLIYGRGDGDPTPTDWSAIVIETRDAGAHFYLNQLTVDDALGGNYLFHAQYNTPQINVTLDIRNSIFRAAAGHSSIFLAASVHFTLRNNLFYFPQNQTVLSHPPTDYTAGMIASLGSGNLYGDPLFKSPAWGATGDYTLRAGSPAINSAEAASALKTDIRGAPRDAKPDRGAYEYRAVPPG